VQIPCSRVYVNTGDPIEEKNLMEFRLLYQGELPSSGNKGHPKEKHEIRRAFHPQLRRLWKQRQNLRLYAFQWFSRNIQRTGVADPGPDKPELRLELGFQEMGRNWSKAGYDLVPLVIPEFAPQCSLDILLLRPDSRTIFSDMADLDGQVKTILDALRMPDSREETGEADPEEDEHPLFCLLQNDKLISEVKITADQLLMLPYQHITERDSARGQINLMVEDSKCQWNFAPEEKVALRTAQEVLANHGAVRATDAFVVIHVRLNHRDARTWDNYFG
jgi:hypothetical protein